MSDLETLIVTFQTQLSDVMETVVKTAVYEVTRLVEDGLLEEVKRRNQEVESLRMQLQWAENKLSDGKDRNDKRCAGWTMEDVELSTAEAQGPQAGKNKLIASSDLLRMKLLFTCLFFHRSFGRR